MEHLTQYLPFVLVAVIFILRTYYKKTWEKVHKPLLIIVSVLSALLSAVMLFAVYTMFRRDLFSAIGKVGYCLLIAGVIGFFVWVNMTSWKKLIDEQQP